MSRNYCLVVFLLFTGLGFSQVTQQDTLTDLRDSIGDYYIRFEGDSVLHSSIELEEVILFGDLEFANRKERLRYLILRRKTLKVYPYAKLAAERLEELNDSLQYIKKRRHQKRYTRKVQKYIEGEFSEELKKLTRTEGQILVKLIHRQTGDTAFDLIKELRTGWRAFWYNTTASLFDISLKEEFVPEMVHEDYLIEDILQRAFAAQRLERQESVLGYDFAQLTNKWKENPPPPKD